MYKLPKIMKINEIYLFLQLATTLLEKEVMTYNEIERLIGAPPHGAKHKVELVDPEMESLSNNSEIWKVDKDIITKFATSPIG
jgi:hypothetical protein